MNGTEIALIITALGVAVPSIVAAVLSVFSYKQSLVNTAALLSQAQKLEEQHHATNSRLDQLIAAKVEQATLLERIAGEKKAKEVEEARDDTAD